MDKSCIGEGATHNACPCFLERMGKLEQVREAAEDLASNAFAECSTKTAPRIDYFVDAEKLDKLKIILAALRETEER